jgi:uncharacterized protein
MNTVVDAGLLEAHAIAQSVASACDRIAPSWPLDQLIAVNPYWGWVQHPAPEAAARLGALCGTRLTMPRAWFREQWQAGRLRAEHLQAAIERGGGGFTVERLLAAMEAPTAPPARLPLVSDLLSASHAAPAAMTWADLVTHQISQHCAAFFDDGQARWRLGDASLYGSWRRQIAADRGIAWRRGRQDIADRLRALPEDAEAAIAAAVDALRIPPAGSTNYLTAVLLSVNGWAAWCAYHRWQARLSGRDDDHLLHLLAIRLSWECLLMHDAQPAAIPAAIPAGWATSWATADTRIDALMAEQQADWLLQSAIEIAYQQPLCESLAHAAAAEPAPQSATSVQAVFCIDVRSEVFRRALEAADPGIRTRGFAGFFGLPIAYSPVGSALTRPQLPGLLAPALRSSEAADAPSLAQALATRRGRVLDWRRRWADLRGSAASGFSFVESCGLGYAAKLLAGSLPSTTQPPRWEDAGLPASAHGLRPRLASTIGDVAASAQLAAGILGAMGLTHGFAPIVLLAGHGSQTANNPHAAGLDCGACGGQTGEVNARVLADLLNDMRVRQALLPLGITIPEATHFVPALHNTTTDEVTLFDTDAVPTPLRGAVHALQRALAEAGQRTRAERSESLGLQSLADQPDALATRIRRRANDWAEVRPEWGLADNAAFIVAPRHRTRHLNLAGHSFLHDYDWRADADGKVLELIMTAPMVVTNWINLQYHASTVDNRRFGSGNKVLHNVVGGHIGVFEGNGGDLRIGLPLQSLHDGRQWRHTPLRLAVFIEAPKRAIDGVIHKHQVVRHLVDNGWLHLHAIDGEAGIVWRHTGNGSWAQAAATELHP